jgi:hypothetical protein
MIKSEELVSLVGNFEEKQILKIDKSKIKNFKKDIFVDK